MNFIFADFIDVKAPANHSHTLKARRALSLEAIRWHIDEVHRNEIHCLWFQFGRVYLENAAYKTAYFIKLRKENSSKMLAQWNYRSFFVFFFFFFFCGGGGGGGVGLGVRTFQEYTLIYYTLHLHRADRSSKVGENRRTRGKATWPSEAELGFPTCDLSEAWTTAVRNLMD